jgi:hypothetical protein
MQHIHVRGLRQAGRGAERIEGRLDVIGRVEEIEDKLNLVEKIQWITQ